jgi:hypothetical protein
MICTILFYSFPTCFGCETWSLTLSDGHRLSFENRLLREIFGPKRNEVTGEWGDCVIGSFMFCTAHQALIGLSENEMVGYTTCMGKRWGAYRVLVGKRMGKKQLGTLRHKWG